MSSFSSRPWVRNPEGAERRLL